MGNAETAAVIASIVVASGALAAGAILVIRGRLRALEREVLAAFAGQPVVAHTPSANFFGQSSLGPAQPRGNGALVLTASELYFRLLLPRREWRIPLARIASADTTRAHLGKTKGRLLLRLKYTDERGQHDSAAWLVPDLDSWLLHLRTLGVPVRS